MEYRLSNDGSLFLPSEAAKTIAFMRPFAKDLGELRGQSSQETKGEYSSETIKNAIDLSLDPEVLGRWARGLIQINDDGVYEANPASALSMYFTYFRQFMHSSPEDVEDAVAGTLDAYPDQQAYFSKLARVGNPLVASTTLFLYDHFRRLSKPGKKKTTTWYENVFNNVVEADHYATEFMNTFQYRQDKISHNPHADQFLGALNLEIQRNIAEIIAYSNGYAISSLISPNNGFMVSSMNVGVSPRDFHYAVQEIYALDRGPSHKDGRAPIMNEFGQDIMKWNSQLNEDSGYVIMPVCTGSFDGLKYSEFTRDFWKALCPKLDKSSPHPDLSYEDNSAKYKLGNIASVLIRPFPRQVHGRVNAQARMALMGEGVFDKLSIRVDDEGDRLRVDMGGTTFAKALALGEGIIRVDEVESAASVMSQIREVYRFYQEYGFGPSIMKPLEILYTRDGILDPFTLSDKMAIMTSVMHTTAAGLGMRMEPFFGYHSDSLNTEEFRKNFRAIMLSCASAVEFPVV